MRVLIASFIAVQLGAMRVAALRDGDMLGPDNWSQARDLLPEEILQHYRLGEYRNAIMDVSGGQFMSLPPIAAAAIAEVEHCGA